MMDSSSMHKWNSDTGLNHFEKILWMIVNWINNHWFPSWTDSNLSVGHFNPVITQDSWDETYETMTSPSRTLAQIFMLKLPWQEIYSELGNIHVLDIGCGSGNNAARLLRWSGGMISTYVGMDLKRHNNWDKVVDKFSVSSFLETDVADIANCFKVETNFIFSQSSIEHFTDDIKLFHDIYTFVRQRSKPVIQVHLLPSSVGLSLYRWHGVRQYTPRTISMLTKIFNDCSYARLYPLGGKKCNIAHVALRRFQQRSSIDAERTKVLQDEYADKVREAIMFDSEDLHPRPAFYALVIHSNWSRRMF
tara:strand:- start:25382 stop:26296 length:915 start_codon:yes stop_codon:yes gene_type:complete